MLDDAAEKERCLLRIKAAYSIGLYGADPAVLNGTAAWLVDDAYKSALITASGTKAPVDAKRKVGGKSGPSKKPKVDGGIDGYFKQKT